MTRLLIIGAGGHAKVVAETALASGVASQIAFLDDRCSGPDQLPHLLGWPVIGPSDKALDTTFLGRFPAAAVAIGQSRHRLDWIEKLQGAGYALPVLIHPTAWLSSSAQVGPASVLFAQAAVQAHASIGIGAILNTGCSVDHDVRIADGVHICPGSRLAGGVHVGIRSWMGIGSSVIQQVRIGADVTVGAGAAVVRDLPDGVTAVGVPARVLPKP